MASLTTRLSPRLRLLAATLLALGLLFLDHSLEARIQQHHPLPSDEPERPKEP